MISAMATIRGNTPQCNLIWLQYMLGFNGCLLNFCTDESSASPSTTTSTNEEPIYHVLERPLLCEDCLRNDRRISHRQLPSPPLPPFSPTPPPPPREAAPLYERVGSFRKSQAGVCPYLDLYI